MKSEDKIMEISNQINNYQALSSNQHSQVSADVPDTVDVKKTEAVVEQEQKDVARNVAVDYTAAQSKKSQVEIYLASANDAKAESNTANTASILESLRDVQKQNKAVDAYATYKENQQASQPALLGT